MTALLPTCRAGTGVDLSGYPLRFALSAGAGAGVGAVYRGRVGAGPSGGRDYEGLRAVGVQMGSGVMQ